MGDGQGRKHRFTNVVFIRIDNELKLQIENRANEKGLNLSAYIRTVLIRELKRGEK